jgi:hypothetical protein
VEPIWYLAKNILPVEEELVLLFDSHCHYVAFHNDGVWTGDDGRRLVLSPGAYWTDLPRPQK